MKNPTIFVIVLILITSLQAKDLKQSEILIPNPNRTVFNKLSDLQIPYDVNHDNEILIQQAGLGIQGTVTDAATGEPIQAMISANQGVPFHSDSWRFSSLFHLRLLWPHR